MVFSFNFEVMFWFLLLLIFMEFGADCDRVQFFKNEDYEHFVQEFDISGDAANRCHTLKNMTHLGSLKTNRCIMLFAGPGCRFFQGYKVMYQSTSVEADTPYFSDYDFVQSFQVCSREVGGGPEVDVDFYSVKEYDSLNENPQPMEFRDVCGCRNLEKSFVGGKTKTISVDNWGHSIDIFEEEHCTGQMRTLPGGSSIASMYLWPGNDGLDTFDVQSFRPTNSNGCVKLHAEIYKFDFKNGTNQMMKSSKVEKIKLVTDSIIESNGAASIVQEFTVAGKITEGLEYTTASGFTNMDSYGVSVILDTTVETGIPLLANGDITTDVIGQYVKTPSITVTVTNKTSLMKEETITARQQISVPPCTECVVSTFVKKVKNFPIAYTTYSRVTGSASGDRMLAEDVRAALNPDAEYLGDVDDYSVVIMVEGVMYAEFSLNSFMSANCKPIPGCIVTSKR